MSEPWTTEDTNTLIGTIFYFASAAAFAKGCDALQPGAGWLVWGAWYGLAAWLYLTHQSKGTP